MSVSPAFKTLSILGPRDGDPRGPEEAPQDLRAAAPAGRRARRLPPRVLQPVLRAVHVTEGRFDGVRQQLCDPTAASAAQLVATGRIFAEAGSATTLALEIRFSRLSSAE